MNSINSNYFPQGTQQVLNKNLINEKLESLENLKTLSNLFKEKVEESLLQPVRKEKLAAENQKILEEIEKLENMLKIWNENLKPKSPKRDIFKEIGNKLKRLSPTNKSTQNLKSKSVQDIGVQFQHEYDKFQKIYSNLFLKVEDNFKYLNRREQLQLLIDDINQELPILKEAVENLQQVNFSEIMHDESVSSLFSNNEHLFMAFKAQIGAYYNQLKSDSKIFEKESFNKKPLEAREKDIERSKSYLQRWKEKKEACDKIVECLRKKNDAFFAQADKINQDLSHRPKRRHT